MKCEQFETRWQQLLDDRLPVSSDSYLMAHCLTCESCAALVESTESLLYGLEYDYDVPELDEDFAQQVVAAATTADNWRQADEVSPERSSGRKRGGWSLAWGPMAIAAAAAVWMVIAAFNDAPNDHYVAVDLRGPSLAQPVLDPSPNEPVSNEQDLAMQEMQALLFELAGKFPKDEAARMLSDHMQRLDNVARPVANSVGTAITAIYRSVGNTRPDKSAQKYIPTIPVA